MTKSNSNKNDYIVTAESGIDPREAVMKVMTDIDISFVDPELFPAMIPIMTTFHETYLKRNDPDEAKRAKIALEYMIKAPRRAELNEYLAKQKVVKKEVPPALTQEEVEREVEIIFNGGDIRVYTQDELDLVIAGMRAKKAKLISEKNYLLAQKAEHLAKILISNGQLSRVEDMQTQKTAYFEDKVCEAQRTIKEHKAKWESIHHNMCIQAEKDFKNTLEQHESNLEQLEQMRKEPLPTSFRKCSNELLQLRWRESAMLASKNYKEAAYIKQMADQMQEQEDMVNYMNYQRKIDKMIELENTRYQRNMSARRLYWKNEETKVINCANDEIEQAEIALDHLLKHKDGTKKQVKLVGRLKKEALVVNSGFDSKSEQTPLEYRQRAILNHKIYTKISKKKKKSKRASI